MRTEDIVKKYNELVQSHKRLPLNANERLTAGETIMIYNGTQEQWTSRLTLTADHARMDINETLPARMVAQLKEKQTQFAAFLERSTH